MNEVSAKKKPRATAAEREKVFKEVCTNFPPAMRFFFFEKFGSPGSYCQAVSAYTRSVATNSVCSFFSWLIKGD